MDSTALPRALRTTRWMPRRLGEVISAEIVAAIAKDKYPVGSKLPTEPELQAQFGISRTAVREALKWVESRGLISIRQGRGAQVNPIELWDLTDPDVLSVMLTHNSHLEIFDQLMAVREMLEPSIAGDAAREISDARLESLSDLLDQMGQQLDNLEKFQNLDVEFHDVIASSSPNLIARSVMRSIAEPLFIARRMMSEIPESSRLAHADHLAILDALSRHDEQAARDSMHRHLTRSHRQLIALWDQTQSG